MSCTGERDQREFNKKRVCLVSGSISRQRAKRGFNGARPVETDYSRNTSRKRVKVIMSTWNNNIIITIIIVIMVI